MQAAWRCSRSTTRATFRSSPCVTSGQDGQTRPRDPREPGPTRERDRSRGLARLPCVPGEAEYRVAADGELRPRPRARRDYAGAAELGRRLRGIVTRGPIDPSRLTEEERVQFAWAFYEMFGAFEFMFHQSEWERCPARSGSAGRTPCPDGPRFPASAPGGSHAQRRSVQVSPAT
jgi:hypothetical protein